MGKLSYEQFLAALCLWREARNQTMPVMRAIYQVIRNRAADRRWPDSIPGVILQPFQFSSFNAGDPNATKFPTPSAAADWDAFQRCLVVVDAPLEADSTGGANHYESISDPAHRPAWCKPEKVTLELGPFRFYKL